MVSGRSVVDGRFELIDSLGSGGMGTVWRAYDGALHREVALKEVLATESGEASNVQRERVLREARALARIGHPNVVAIHHIVDSPAEPHPWLVMELVRGGSLADRLVAGPMSPPRVAQIGRGLLAGLRAAHAVGVQHRDIKPANVLLREDDSPVLTDFGIAEIAGQEGLTATGIVLGSLEYVAPERLAGVEGHPASDLWSLGLVLFVAVEGYHPMRRDTSIATLAAVMKGEVPPARQAGPLTPVLRALLTPDPDRRPTLEQVDSMLAQAISGASEPFVPVYSIPAVPPHASDGPIPAQSGPPLTTLPPPRGIPAPRRTGIWLGAGSAAVVVVAAVAAVLVWPHGGSTATGTVSTVTASATPGPAIPGGIPSVTTAPGGPRTADLLTPAGVRQAIAALEQVTGGKQFTETTIYPTFVNTGAPVENQPTLYDTFVYRDGKAGREGAGGELDGDKTVDLDAIAWDTLPTLLQTAQAKLGVAEPTMRYVIVDPAWTFNDDKPTLRVYLSDDYGGAYLAADIDGTVVRLVPRK